MIINNRIIPGVGGIGNITSGNQPAHNVTKPNSNFEDIFAALALYRPGPMSNIDSDIKRREG